MQSFFSMAGGGGQTRCFTGDVQMANTTNNRFYLKRNALAGNRTRASRVAGENSTTEPPVPC